MTDSTIIAEETSPRTSSTAKRDSPSSPSTSSSSSAEVSSGMECRGDVCSFKPAATKPRFGKVPPVQAPEPQGEMECKDGVCTLVTPAKRSGFRLNSTKQKIPLTHHQPLKQSVSTPAKLRALDPPERFSVLSRSEGDVTNDCSISSNGNAREQLKTKPPSFKKKFLSSLGSSTKNLRDKRVTRLDLRLNVIIKSAMQTLLMISLFVVCYMPWWLLSIDILSRLV